MNPDNTNQDSPNSPQVNSSSGPSGAYEPQSVNPSLGTQPLNYTANSQMQAEPPRKSKKTIWIALAFVVIVAAVVAYILVARNSTSDQATKSNSSSKTSTSAVQKSPHLLVFDFASGKYILADKNGKKINELKVDVTTGDYPSLSTYSSDGQLLINKYSSLDQTYGYTLIGKDGKEQVISQTALSTLGSKTAPQYSVFYKENTIIWVDCTTADTDTTNKCKLQQLNLVTGDSKTILDTTAPQAFATGESIFNLLGISSDNSTLYIEASGPTKLGADSQDTLYSFNIASGQAAKIYQFPKDRPVDNLTISSDAKRVVYDEQVGDGGPDESANIYTVDIGSGKEVKTSWDESISGGGYPFVWSPDNTKVSVVGNKLPPTDKPLSGGPITTGYLTVKANTVSDLQVIQDSTTKYIKKQYWLDDSTLIYNLETGQGNSTFTNSNSEIFQQNLSSKTATKSNITGSLIAVVWY